MHLMLIIWGEKQPLKVFLKKVFLKILQNSQGNTCIRAFFRELIELFAKIVNGLIAIAIIFVVLWGTSDLELATL